MLTNDTIAAIATGAGEGGIGIIRISGSNALGVGDSVFQSEGGKPLRNRRSHTVAYGWILNAEGRKIDEVLAVVMHNPRSFTGEDVVEFHCHGGLVATREVLRAVLNAGARMAAPGEFTKRAFLNGRMDLAQAEAVVDIIRAKTERALSVAVRQLQGTISEAVGQARLRLLEMMAHLEADIDFPELELGVQTLPDVVAGTHWCLDKLREVLGSARQGRLLREGYWVVLTGRPNVGKSSLLNRLTRKDRALVTDIPGTTRDVIEEWINLRGVPVVLVDTAGIRQSTDLIEQLGMERTRAAAGRADLIIVVLDGSEGLTPDDKQLIDNLPGGVARMAVVNKVDLAGDIDEGAIVAASGAQMVVGVSAKTGQGLETLEEAIAEAAGISESEETYAVNLRQEEALTRAIGHLEESLETVSSGFGSEMVSIDIRAAWEVLGEITGESARDDLLDSIFSRFCIGK